MTPEFVFYFIIILQIVINTIHYYYDMKSVALIGDNFKDIVEWMREQEKINQEILKRLNKDV